MPKESSWEDPLRARRVSIQVGYSHFQKSHSEDAVTMEGQGDEEGLRDWELMVTGSNFNEGKGQVRSEVNEAG